MFIFSESLNNQNNFSENKFSVPRAPERRPACPSLTTALIAVYKINFIVIITIRVGLLIISSFWIFSTIARSTAISTKAPVCSWLKMSFSLVPLFDFNDVVMKSFPVFITNCSQIFWEWRMWIFSGMYTFPPANDALYHVYLKPARKSGVMVGPLNLWTLWIL